MAFRCECTTSMHRVPAMCSTAAKWNILIPRCGNRTDLNETILSENRTFCSLCCFHFATGFCIIINCTIKRLLSGVQIYTRRVAHAVASCSNFHSSPTRGWLGPPTCDCTRGEQRQFSVQSDWSAEPSDIVEIQRWSASFSTPHGWRRPDCVLDTEQCSIRGELHVCGD